MKDSIHTRLFLGIIFLTLVFTCCSWLVNSLFSKSFYLFSKKQKLNAIAEEIELYFDGNKIIDETAIERIEYEKNVHIGLLDKNYQLIYDSLSPSPFRDFTDNQFPNENKAVCNSQAGHWPGPPAFLQDFKDDHFPRQFMPFKDFENSNCPEPPFPPFPSFPFFFNGNNIVASDSASSHYTLYEQHDHRLNVDYLKYVRKLANDHTLYLFTAVAPIKESASLANTLALITGSFALLVGSILALLFTNWFSRPIIELKKIAGLMTHLDFSCKYTDSRKDEVGELGRSINILSDQLHHAISGLETANNRLKKDIEREQKLEVMRKNFISNVSHELKTPLALIQGYAEGLRSNIVHNKQKRNVYCRIIIDEAMKMDRLIRDLLDISQLDSGQFSIRFQPINIFQLIERIIEKFKPIFKKEAVNFSKEIDYRETVYGDPDRIEQVLVNYINNALCHMDKERIIKISIKNFDSFIRIAVYNSGEPIPEEELENIWISFYKIDQARTRRNGETGLGLSIVRSILNLHKVAYGVYNRPKGVEFWFNLDKNKSLPLNSGPLQLVRKK